MKGVLFAMCTCVSFSSLSLSLSLIAILLLFALFISLQAIHMHTHSPLSSFSHPLTTVLTLLPCFSRTISLPISLCLFLLYSSCIPHLFLLYSSPQDSPGHTESQRIVSLCSPASRCECIANKATTREGCLCVYASVSNICSMHVRAHDCVLVCL